MRRGGVFERVKSGKAFEKVMGEAHRAYAELWLAPMSNCK